ncbi:MAG: DUF4145 domain-containing protein [Terriglobia bacterium]
MAEIGWNSVQNVHTFKYTCGFCGSMVASQRGWDGQIYQQPDAAKIRICPNCNGPTYFGSQQAQCPGVSFGVPVTSLPPDVDRLYREARDSTSIGAYTSTVMVCRKILSNVSVYLGAEPGQTFERYVDWLENNGHIPPKGRPWVDRIRNKGNEANHEIAAIGKADAEQMITFLGMLLKIVFEFPAQLSEEQG